MADQQPSMPGAPVPVPNQPEAPVAPTAPVTPPVTSLQVPEAPSAPAPVPAEPAQQSAPTPVAPQSEVMPTKRRGGKVILVAVLLIIILALAGGGVWYYLQSAPITKATKQFTDALIASNHSSTYGLLAPELQQKYTSEDVADALVDGGITGSLSSVAVTSRERSGASATVKGTAAGTSGESGTFQLSLSQSNKSWYVSSFLVKLTDAKSVDSAVDIGKTKRYSNASAGFSTKHLKTWEVENAPGTSAQGVIFYSPKQGDSDVFRENVIVITEAAGSETLATVKEQVLEVNKAFVGDFAIVQEGETKLGGEAAQQLVFTGTDIETGAPLKFMQLWTIKGTQLYTITYTALPSAYDTQWSGVEMITRNFKFL